MPSLRTYTSPLPARTWITWRPGRDTLIAAGSVLVMWAVYLAQSLLLEVNPVAAISLFVALGMLALSTGLPVYVVWHRMRRDADDLGFTTRRMWLAVVVSVVIGLGSLPAFWSAAAGAGINPVDHTWVSILSVWEPLFVFGWLQLRFRDAFGELPAPLLAGLCCGIYHLGSTELANAAFYAGLAVVLGALFALSRNLFTVVPITWALATGIATIGAGARSDVNSVALLALVLIAQAAIVIVAYRRHPGDPRGSDPQPADDRGATELRMRAERAARAERRPGRAPRGS